MRERQSLFIKSHGNVFDDRADAIEGRINFGKTYFDAAWGKLANDANYGWTAEDDKNQSAADTFYAFVLGGNYGNLHGEATYLKANDVKAMGMQGDDKIWTLGADYQAGKLNINAMYLKGDNDYIDKVSGTDDDGYVVGLNYAGAETGKPGTWGLYAKYYDQSAPTVLAHTMNGDYTMFDTYGFKGYMVGGNLTVAKNMVATVEYYDLKGKGGDLDNSHARTLWSELNVTF